MWLENTEPSYRYFTARAAEILNEADGDKDKAAETLADEIRETVESTKPTHGGNLYDDILTNALAEANYYDIAQSFLEL